MAVILQKPTGEGGKGVTVGIMGVRVGGMDVDVGGAEFGASGVAVCTAGCGGRVSKRLGIAVGISVTLGAFGVGERLLGGKDMPVQISAMPIALEKILGTIDILGTSISFAFIPPPKRPTRRAMQPATVRTIGRVIKFSIVESFFEVPYP